MAKVFFHIFITLFICLLASVSAAEKEKRNILYLNSYHNGYRWSDKQLDGIRSVLNKSPYKIDLQIEYMDAKKYNYDTTKQRLYTLYKEKFQDEHFDVIIISDNDALNFMQEFRSRLFPNSPVVFCGINGIETVKDNHDNMTGIIEDFDLVKTLEIVRTLHPEKKKMIVFGDNSTAGRAIANQITEKLEETKFNLEVEFWAGLSLNESRNRIKEVSDDAFLFFIPWYQTVKGKFYTTEEIIEALYAHTSVPLYTAWEFLLGHGVVGGRVISGFQHGRQAAELALKILEGEDANAIPIDLKPAGVYMFDYKVMEKLGINEDLLPEDAEIINSPVLFYELSKELFWTIIISFVLLLSAMVSLLVTMSERRKVERQVSEQLSFLETLMDTIPQLVSWKDTTGKYLGANRSYIDFFNVSSPDEMFSKTAEDLIGDRDYSKWSNERDHEVVSWNMAFRKIKHQLINKDGEPSWLEINKVPLLDQTGKIVGVLSTAENITKEHNLEKQLIQSQKMEAIGTLAGGIAHDFNNILTSIINSTELALGDLDPESQTAKDLRRVLKAARRGGRVVKQILSFSRPTSEGFKPTDISQIVHEVHSLIEASLPGNITMRVDVEEDMIANSDPTQIHQVLLNLCTNSFHALKGSGGMLKLSVEGMRLSHEEADKFNISRGEYIRVTISDDGHGIEADIMDKIFDPFFSTKDITEGTGLGLAVVHGIIKGHKGGLKVSSTPGEGTTFEIFLPRTGEQSVEPNLTLTSPPTGTLSILFVEDDEDQLNSIPRLLKEMGHEVQAVQDPVAALKLAEERRTTFDIMITDYDMPSMTGEELAEALPDLPVILVSGREDAIAAAGRQSNIIKVLMKPYDGNDLENALGSREIGSKA